MKDVYLCTKDKAKIQIYFSGIGPKAAKLAGLKGDHLITLITNPKVLHEVVFPNFEAGAREAGKDPSKMERAIMFNFLYDPSKTVPKQTSAGGNEEFESKIWVAYGPEDLMAYINELKDMGFNHIICNDLSPSNDPALEALKVISANLR
jgi:alkanesulfonate monooxygenase SsuD/methylene tetrahydromethanopterin reductase-like flavin-dependent oxidoreductase (luciferase family)